MLTFLPQSSYISGWRATTDPDPEKVTMRGIYSLALSPEGEHLYVPLFNEGAVAVFTVGADNGKLSLLQVCIF
jgi:hypothetical protein